MPFKKYEFLVAILILKMERKDNVFDILCFVISKKGKNATEMQKKMLCSVYGEGSMTD